MTLTRSGRSVTRPAKYVNTVALESASDPTGLPPVERFHKEAADIRVKATAGNQDLRRCVKSDNPDRRRNFELPTCLSDSLRGHRPEPCARQRPSDSPSGDITRQYLERTPVMIVSNYMEGRRMVGSPQPPHQSMVYTSATVRTRYR
jgi:hypothetical protein